jgi:hypothetical protein
MGYGSGTLAEGPALGDETIQFASRFSAALTFLEALAGGKTPAGADQAEDVRRALDAVEDVHRTDTRAVRDWPERRARVLAEVARVRAVLERAGPGDALAAAAQALVDLVGPEPRPHSPPSAHRRRRG